MTEFPYIPGTLELQKVPPDVAEQINHNKRAQRIIKQKNYVPRARDIAKPKTVTTKISEQTGTEAFLPCDISRLQHTENATVTFEILS